MKIAVFAVGRMKSGPEKELADRYFDRLAKGGPAVGLEFSGITEMAESRAQTTPERKREEAEKLRTLLSAGTTLIVLDERGKNISSEDFATRIAGWRDSGQRNLLLAIGGPDGHDEALRDKADLVLSFGAQTWPHQITRIMLAEQLYRATTILAGHPYHRA